MSTVDWERDYVPLYRNPDGTTWLRFVGGDRSGRIFLAHQEPIGQLSRQFVSHGSLFDHVLRDKEPVFVRYDPDSEEAEHRRQRLSKPASTTAHIYAVGPAFTWRDGRLTQYPTRGAKWLKDASPFFSWALLPGTTVRFSSSTTPMNVHQISQAWGGSHPPGTPLLDTSIFTMLGTLSPLVADTDVFLEWLQGLDL